MHNPRRVTADTWWVGGNDRRLALFENIYPIPRGVSYNAYLVLDEQTVLLDTADAAIGQLYLDNVPAVLGGRPLDHLIINHMEPDHCALIGRVLDTYPNCRLHTSAKALAMIGQFFGHGYDGRVTVVKEGDCLTTGRHSFSFVMAPMVHWPEAMVSYDAYDKALYSADAFGCFNALDGALWADEVDFERDWLDEARRYYTNIVGKYGAQVQALLNKAAGLDIQLILPLHGPLWRKNIPWFIDKYVKWSTYQPEEQAVLICAASVYGHTTQAAEILAADLAELGAPVRMYELSGIHPSYVLADCFRYSHIVFASSTYNMGIFTPMETLLLDLAAHNLQNRCLALIENGSWAPNAAKLMLEIVGKMKNMRLINEGMTIKSELTEEQRFALGELAKVIAEDVKAV